MSVPGPFTAQITRAIRNLTAGFIPFSDLLVSTSGYINFGTVLGTSGYGFRDNAGTMQYKDSGGGWVDMPTGGEAPALSRYILQGTVDASLPNAQFLGALSSGFVKNTTTTGVLSTVAAITLTTDVTGILPAANGGTGIANASTLTLGGNTAFSGAFTFTGTVTGNTAVTFPTTGTLQTTVGSPAAFVIASQATGDVLYASSASAWARLGIGATGTHLTVAAGVPAWTTATFPATATSTGTMLRADGTNWVATTNTFPNTAATGDLLMATGSNVVGVRAAVAIGQWLISQGTSTAPIYSQSLVLAGTGISKWNVKNTTAGAANAANFEVFADESTGIAMVQTSTSYNTAPSNADDPINIASAGNIISGRGGGINVVGSNGAVRFYSGDQATVRGSFNTDGTITLGGIVRYNGTNSTGAGTALLSTNCPAVTATAPYTWISAKSSDGSAVFIPCWK